MQQFAIQQQQNPYQSIRLLLDGQQRLTSLSAVIRGEPVQVRGRKRPIELLFNLEHPDTLTTVTEVNEEADGDEDLEADEPDASEDELLQRMNQMTFVVSTKKLEQLPQWVKVSEVFKTDSDAPFLKAAGITSFDDPLYEKYSHRLAKLRGIRNYSYRMDILERSLSYDEVTEIFVRVNSLGAKLRSSDLALAQITAKWRHSLEIFQAFQTQCAQNGFDFELGIHLKNLMVFATGQSRFKTVGSLTLENLKQSWEDCKQGMHYAMNFLKSNLGIDSPALLASPFLVIAVAYYGHIRNYAISPEEGKMLRYWALLANAKGRFSRGSSETILDQDLSSIKKQDNILQDLIDRLRQQVGRLDITPDELEGRNQRSALFKTMFLAFRDAGAKDWRSNLTISLDHSGVQHRLQFHHIFPKAQLKTGYTSREADDIANLAFIGGKTNRVISDKPPIEYLPPMIQQHPDAFSAQAIPIEHGLLEISAYKAFLIERRKMISARINQFVGSI